MSFEKENCQKNFCHVFQDFVKNDDFYQPVWNVDIVSVKDPVLQKLWPQFLNINISH